MILFIIIASIFGFGIGMFIEQKNYIENIGKIEIPEATLIYASNKDSNNNRVILAKIYKENRINVKLADIPQNLQNAIISIEDRRFYEHNGVDYKGMLRALVANLKSGGYSQGGSTISMQLARNVKLSQDKTISRKVQEIIIAAQIEHTMSKEEILEAYLNSIYLGSGAFGVQTASNVYFGKDVKNLTLSEAALLAGLPKAPSSYSPHKNLKAAIARRNVVLAAMLKEGYIEKDEYEKAKRDIPQIEPREKLTHKFKYPQIVNYIIDELKERFDEEQIYNGGLRVYSTIDTRIQDAADESVKDNISRARTRMPNVECALLSTDPKNGYIYAMVGSANPNSEFNRCTQAKRQPGSVFKPIVYYTAMEKLDWGPDTRISNDRISFGKWKPKNYEGKYGGTPSMRTAIAQSINLPAIRAAEAAGADNMVEMAKRMGINSKIPPYLSTAIGAGNVKLIEMIQVYNVTANDGMITKPVIIKKVYDTSEKNCLIDNTKNNAVRVVSSELAKNMDSMLRSVMTSGTGRPVSYVADARGKTGTNGKTDVLFAGYVPDKLCTIVWIGDDNNKRLPHSFSGGGTCGPIWGSFMSKADPIFVTIKEEEEKKSKGIEQKIKVIRVKKTSVKEEDKSVPSVDGTIDDVNIPDENVGNSEELPDGSGQTEDSTSGTEVDSTSNNDNTVLVSVCPASNKLPNPNCPTTEIKKFDIRSAPTTTCKIH